MTLNDCPYCVIKKGLNVKTGSKNITNGIVAYVSYPNISIQWDKHKFVKQYFLDDPYICSVIKISIKNTIKKNPKYV